MNDNNISTYYILDLDRTLFDTLKDVELMRGVVALHDANLAGALEREFEKYTLQGESFSMRDFIVENIGEEGLAEIVAKYLELAAGIDLLMPGALDLLAYIRTLENTKLGILTYGSPEGQAIKIQSSGLTDLPHMITGETYKGSLIASWRGEDDLYHLPEELGGFVTKHIVFVDDKPFSFKGIPIDCDGYLVKSVYDAGIEKLPLNVKTVENLNEVIEAEKVRTA